MRRGYNDHGFQGYPLHPELVSDKGLFEELERRDREIHRLEQERVHWKKLYHQCKDACEQQQQHDDDAQRLSSSSQNPAHHHHHHRWHGQQKQQGSCDEHQPDMMERRHRRRGTNHTRDHNWVQGYPSDGEMQGSRPPFMDHDEFSGGEDDRYVLSGMDDSGDDYEYYYDNDDDDDDDLEKCSTKGNWGSDCSDSVYGPNGPMFPDNFPPKLTAGPMPPSSRETRSRRRRGERGRASRHVHFADEVAGHHWQSPRSNLVELEGDGQQDRDARGHDGYFW